MLQMTRSIGAENVEGSALLFYDSAGNVTRTYAIPNDVPNGESQRKILFATTQAAALPGFHATPDFDLGTADSLDPSAGALCFTGPLPADCVTWGPFASPLAFPDPQAQNAVPGVFLVRQISSSICPEWLEHTDDSNDSKVDFPAPEPGPWPVPPENNSAPIVETPCNRTIAFNAAPPNPTNDATPTFDFDESPFALPPVTFRCSLDAAPFLACDSRTVSYGPLSDGLHTFRVYALSDGQRYTHTAEWNFVVDTVPPDTIIDSVPPDPSNGFSATFTFHSSEPESKFRCQFESGPIQPCESGKTIFSLADGPHAFRVWASDQATNVDPTPAVSIFNVDTTLGDKSPPDTTILTRPGNPSFTGRAAFTYRSNEPRSTFRCALDGKPLASCDPAGIVYPRLGNGSHVFRVRAVDRAGNVDSVPASYSWSVKAPLPDTRITASPPGFQRIADRGKKLRVSFAFRSSEARSEFRCRLDRQAFKPCQSPQKVRVAAGRHRFEVYAIDGVGNVEAVPARRIFRIGSKAGSGGFFRLGRSR